MPTLHQTRRMQENMPNYAPAARAIAVPRYGGIFERLERPSQAMPSLFRADSSPDSAAGDAEAKAEAARQKQFDEKKGELEAKFTRLSRALKKTDSIINTFDWLEHYATAHYTKYSGRGDIKNPALGGLYSLAEHISNTDVPNLKRWLSDRVRERDDMRRRIDSLSVDYQFDLPAISSELDGMISDVAARNRGHQNTLTHRTYDEYHPMLRAIRCEIFGKFMFNKVGPVVNAPFRSTGRMVATAGGIGAATLIGSTLYNHVYYGLKTENSAKQGFKDAIHLFPAMIEGVWHFLMAHPMGALTGIIAATSVFKLVKIPLAHASQGEGFWKHVHFKDFAKKVLAYPFKLAAGVAALAAGSAILGSKMPLLKDLEPAAKAIGKFAVANPFTAGLYAVLAGAAAITIALIRSSLKKNKVRAESEKKAVLERYAEGVLRDRESSYVSEENIRHKRSIVMSEIASGTFDKHVVRASGGFAITTDGKEAIERTIDDAWPS